MDEQEREMIRRQTSTHRIGEKIFKAGHYDLLFSDGRVEHFHDERAAMHREAQVEMFKKMDKK